MKPVRIYSDNEEQDRKKMRENRNYRLLAIFFVCCVIAYLSLGE